MLSDRCLSAALSVLYVCNIGVSWPNGWMDHGKTWHTGRPRPWPHCVRWGCSSPSPKGHSTKFSVHICCGQMAGWIKMPLGRKVALDPSDIVLDGDPAPLPKNGGRAPPNFWPMSIVTKQLDGSRCHLVWR